MSEEETITVAALLDGQHHGTTSVVFAHVAGGKMRHFFYLCQCCGSVMLIPDPDFYPSRIPDPKTATKERGKKNWM
jgi:hypothetical protein